MAIGMGKDVFLAGKVIRIPTKAYEDDRGSLIPIEFGDYDFTAVRAFLVAARPGSVRGGHAHANCRQILMLVSGEIEVETRYGDTTERLTLNPAQRAVLIEPPVWSQQTYHGEQPAMIVFCDKPYDSDDYIRNCEDPA
jgi:dTDP-4-dehydrorhamnose 3,5-epimerase-like enzyme